jgi:hypothetical protein
MIHYLVYLFFYGYFHVFKNRFVRRRLWQCA